MSRRVVLVAEPADAELLGVEGSFEWGEIRMGATPGCDLLVELAGAGGGEGPAPRVSWLDRAPDAAAHGALIIAPAGGQLWRRRALPAADACFDLPLPSRPGALLVGSDSAKRIELLERAERGGVALDVVERLELSAMRRASCVILLDAPRGVVSPWAFAVLAARRLLLAPAHDVGFGLRHGIDHLQFGDPDELVAYLLSALLDDDLFEPFRVWGRNAAERRRTSALVGTLVRDLEVEGRLGEKVD